MPHGAWEQKRFVPRRAEDDVLARWKGQVQILLRWRREQRDGAEQALARRDQFPSRIDEGDEFGKGPLRRCSARFDRQSTPTPKTVGQSIQTTRRGPSVVR